VDVTLTDLEGRELEMPSDLDDFGVAGAAEYAGGDAAVAERLGWLQAAMTGAGFRMLASEWWHFSDPEAAVPERPVRAGDCGMVIPVFSAGSRASGGVDQ
jgi:D-alanyl-D-alanine dipeptidase